MHDQLKDLFYEAMSLYNSEDRFTTLCWKEIQDHYCKPDRQYHNLEHLQHMFRELEEVEAPFSNWDALLFSIFYHDIIYDVHRTDNEARSADFLEHRLSETTFGAIAHCKMQINASKGHLHNTDEDTNFFLDADLSILGQQWIDYQQYTRKIRMEYAIYPASIYLPGRIKVLEHFLQQSAVFKTGHFKEKYEEQAKKNMLQELELLRQQKSELRK